MSKTTLNFFEKELVNSNLLESVFANTSDTIITINREGQVLFANRTSYANRHQIKEGAYLFDQESDINAQKINEVVRTVFETKESGQYFINSSDLEDEEMIYAGTVNPVLNDNDEVVAVTIIARDLTETINTKKELENFEKRLRLALSVGQIVVWEWSIKHQTLIIEGEYESIYEKSAQDENSFDDLLYNVSLDDRSALLAELTESIATGEGFEYDYRIQFDDHSTKFLHLNVHVVLNTRGKPIRLIGAIQDLTPQKETEFRILQAIVSTQEEERSRLGKEMHDNIGQLLTATKLNLNTGIVKLKKQDDTALQKFELAQTILATAMEETRNFSHQLAAVYLLKGLHFALDELVKNMSGDDFEMEIDTRAIQGIDLPDMVTLNMYRIAQELLNNAIKHASAQHIKISLDYKQGEITLEVADDGVGIDLEKGVEGIGLMNVQNRVDSLKGKMEIQQVSGGGTKVSVSCFTDLYTKL